MSHRNLEVLDDQSLYYELNESRTILKQRFGLGFYALAYPFGMFDERVKRFAYKTGYHCALCFGNTMSNTRFTDPFEMKREKILCSTSFKDFVRLVEIRCDFIRKIKYLTEHFATDHHRIKPNAAQQN